MGICVFCARLTALGEGLGRVSLHFFSPAAVAFSVKIVIFAGEMKRLSKSIKEQLRLLADRYETADFLKGDPSQLMHEVEGERNQETTAFIASCLSYGSRKQFLPKLYQILEWANGDVYHWVLSGRFANDVPDDGQCFYRLYNRHLFHHFLDSLRSLLLHWGSLGGMVEESVRTGDADKTDVLRALEALSGYFWQRGLTGIVPRPGSSLCKRPVMFLRWMVRSGSPVDLGCWAGLLDRRNLLIPLDTHVLQTANRLRLLESKSASWSTVLHLSSLMAQVFPDDPARGDFALYGYDVMGKSEGQSAESL
jgi:uncharacterized protein (TIGR02757 family)